MLGVLCEVFGYPKVSDIDDQKYVNTGTFLAASAACPSSVMEMVGLASSLGRYNVGCLTQCNDGLKLTFEELADLIESEPAGLFI